MNNSIVDYTVEQLQFKDIYIMNMINNRLLITNYSTTTDRQESSYSLYDNAKVVYTQLL